MNKNIKNFTKELFELSKKYGVYIDTRHGNYYSALLVDEEDNVLADDLSPCEDGYYFELADEEHYS